MRHEAKLALRGGVNEMALYVHVTVNSPRGEYEYTTEQQTSLDALLKRVLEQHPSATSMVMSIVPDKDGIGQKLADAI